MDKKSSGRPKKIIHKSVSFSSSTKSASLCSNYTKVNFIIKNMDFYKQTINTFKDIGSMSMIISFDSNRVLMYSDCRDSSGGIMAIIPVSTLEQYKCIEPIIIRCETHNLASDITSHFSTHFQYARFEINSDALLKVILHNMSNPVVEVTTEIRAPVTFDKLWKSLDAKITELSNYPIRFMLSARQFKYDMKILNKCVTNITIECTQDYIAFISINMADTQLKKSVTYRNLANINATLPSNISTHPVKIEIDFTNISSIINSSSTDVIHFFIHQSKDLIVQVVTGTGNVISVNIPHIVN